MNTKALVALLAIAVVGVAAYLVVNRDGTSVATPATTRDDTTTRSADEEVVTDEGVASDTPAPTNSTATSQPDETTAASTPYNATATYLTPARTSHEVAVTLSLNAEGVVTGANVTYDNQDGYSNAHQERFDAAYRAEVVGKTLDEIDLAQVGGASLTSEAFNQAVSDIAAQYEA